MHGMITVILVMLVPFNGYSNSVEDKSTPPVVNDAMFGEYRTLGNPGERWRESQLNHS